MKSAQIFSYILIIIIALYRLFELRPILKTGDNLKFF